MQPSTLTGQVDYTWATVRGRNGRFRRHGIGMEAPHLERKLVAILAADFEGFSRHMERDEIRTLTVLSSHRLIIDASISEFGGRITGTAGDSVLAEFGSVISAVNCAVQIQQVLVSENAELDEERRLLLRIGINVGDVMMKDGDIFGDGVNIAARLESLAEPGGICVSRGVRDHLRKHRIVVFDDLGEQKVKNIAHPVRAFKVRIGEAPPGETVDPHFEAPGEDGLAVAPSPLAGDAEVELAFWDAIKDSENAVEFCVYLERYPDGPFAVLAQTRRDALIAAAEEGAGSGRSEAASLEVELAFWEAAKDSSNCVELEAYLQRYPEGEFVALASARLKTLQEVAAEPPVHTDGDEVELTFWNSVKDKGNPDMFRAYLDKYPKGAFAELARINLEPGGLVAGKQTGRITAQSRDRAPPARGC
ncbi:Adenylate cyclase, class 3 [Rhizobiales bacterium GAS188]|nr:Adenylate cyclase, class 3 [Rhizobiales bacterium GAS188]